MRWHVSASLLLHAVILLALIFRAPMAAPKPHEDASIDVEIVALPQQKQPVTTAKAEQPPLTADRIILAARSKPLRKTTPDPDMTPKPNALIPAMQLYSGKLLADRHNKSTREAMKTLAVDERIIQLCNIEAMEQVRRAGAALKPDYVIAYAMADLRLSAHGVDAEGGAFHSRRNWYGLRFKCDVSPDDSKVVSFAFFVGKPIPKSQWVDHNLTADDSSAD